MKRSDEETSGPSPCDECANRVRCARDRMACQQFVLWCRPNGGMNQTLPRIPSRIDYLRAHQDLIINDCYTVIAEVRRRAAAEKRRPTMAEMMDALNLDKQATTELLLRYMAKQGMTLPASGP